MKKVRNNHSIRPKTRKKKYIGGNAGTDFIETATNVAKKTANIIDGWVPTNIIRNFVGDNVRNKDWSAIMPNIFNNFNETAELITYAAHDSELRKVLKQSIEVYGVAITDIFEIAKPVIEELTSQFWEMMNEIGTNSISGSINATISTFTAAISAVPGLGGAVASVIALSKWYNAVASGITAPITVFSGKLSGETIQFGRNSWAFKTQHGEELAKTYNDVTNMLDRAKDLKTAGETTQNSNMSGGSRYKADRTLRNIHTSIKRFTQKRALTPRFG